MRPRLVAFPNKGLFVAPTLLYLVVEAVVGDVYLASAKPPGEGRIPLEDLIPLLEPVQLPGALRPETLVVFLSLLEDGEIVCVGLPDELLRRFVGTVG